MFEFLNMFDLCGLYRILYIYIYYIIGHINVSINSIKLSRFFCAQ